MIFSAFAASSVAIAQEANDIPVMPELPAGFDAPLADTMPVIEAMPDNNALPELQTLDEAPTAQPSSAESTMTGDDSGVVTFDNPANGDVINDPQSDMVAQTSTDTALPSDLPPLPPMNEALGTQSDDDFLNANAPAGEAPIFGMPLPPGNNPGLLPTLPVGPNAPSAETPAVDAEIALPDDYDTVYKAPKEHRIPKLNAAYNFRRQYLPSAIYSKQYNAKNKHLPVARQLADYQQWTFAAVSRNDINGVRALLQTGLPLSMTNDTGETLVDVAVRYRAYGALRLLLAYGAPAGMGFELAQQQGDSVALAALQSAIR